MPARKKHRKKASKQYLTWGSADNAHIMDIFTLAVTDKQILSGGGDPAIKVHSTTGPEFPLVQSIDNAHDIGCHHLVTDGTGTRAASAGFDGKLKIWSCQDGYWALDQKLSANLNVGDVWAITLSLDGQYLAGVTQAGRINVWDLAADANKIRDHETRGKFGTCIDLSADGRFIATGHDDGSVYVFTTETGRMPFSLAGLVKSVRSVAFSPGGKILAAAGNSGVIILYDTASGEQIANLKGDCGWIMSLAWSNTGEYLLSGSFTGKAKVWSMETKTCVATLSQSEKTIWSSKWIPKTTKTEGFATAGGNSSIAFYREATG